MSTNITKKQVAIVTGASSGMGLGITQALLQHSNRVVANSRSISKSKDLKPSSDLILVDGDIGKKNTAIKVADAAIKHFDRMDLLVNNAGIYIPKPFTDYTPADFDLMIGTNVAGYFFYHARSGHTNAQTEVRPYRGHLDAFGGSAVGRRDDCTACTYQVHHSGV
ncbi:MAG: SDR family oxidoreductase [Candidatus Nitrosopolaris sp.]|jgi:NAD(P)-dependent dehydrogenase (short-subunit alcohol dehydrogenase family)